MSSTPDLDNRALRHLKEARDAAHKSELTLRQKCVLACLIGIGMAGLFLLLAWPAQ